MLVLRNLKARYIPYRKFHPLDNKIEIKNEIAPYDAFREALKNFTDNIDDCTNQL